MAFGVSLRKTYAEKAGNRQVAADTKSHLVFPLLNFGTFQGLRAKGKQAA